jgi:hypothetical protein
VSCPCRPGPHGIKTTTRESCGRGPGRCEPKKISRQRPAAGRSRMALLSPPLPPLLSPARQRAASSPLLAPSVSTTSILSLCPHHHRGHDSFRSSPNGQSLRRRRRGVSASVEQEDAGATETTVAPKGEPGPPISSDAGDADSGALPAKEAEASPEDLESIREIKRVRCF